MTVLMQLCEDAKTGKLVIEQVEMGDNYVQVKAKYLSGYVGRRFNSKTRTSSKTSSMSRAARRRERYKHGAVASFRVARRNAHAGS